MLNKVLTGLVGQKRVWKIINEAKIGVDELNCVMHAKPEIPNAGMSSAECRLSTDRPKGLSTNQDGSVTFLLIRSKQYT